jgi:SAM-dependent methyltransferase
MSTTEKNSAHKYILGTDEGERSRLLAQCEIHRAADEHLLEHLGIGAGGRVLDVGCGPLGVDLAHERLVLINVAAPQDVVAEMVRVVCPGGWVVVENADWISWTCEPAHRAWGVLLDALIAAWRAAGLDPFIGRRMPMLLRRAGLIDIAVDAHAHTSRSSDAYQTPLIKFLDIFRDRIIDGGFLVADQLHRLVAELEEHLARPETFVIDSLFFQAWGRKPA